MKKAKIFKFTLSIFMAVVLAFAVLTVVACEKPHEHTYGEWTTVTEAKCIEAGLEKRVCSECDESAEGHEETRPIPALGHTYSLWVTVTAASCTEAGLEKRVCGLCAESTQGHEETRPIAASGHDWDEGEVTKAPTYNSKGIKTFTCERDCEEEKTEDVAALGVPEAFRGTWVSEGGPTFVISGNSVSIEDGEITEWDGANNVITSTWLNDDDEYDITIEISGDDELTVTVAKAGSLQSQELIYTKQVPPAPTYGITVNLNNNAWGEYALSPEGPYESGDEVVLTVTPEEGYEIASVTNGQTPLTAQPNGTYLITVGDANVTINVTFRQISSGGGNGGGNPPSQTPTFAQEDYVGTWVSYYRTEDYLTISISGNGLSVVMTGDQNQTLYFELSGNKYVDSVNNYEMYMEEYGFGQYGIVLKQAQSSGSGDFYEKSSGLTFSAEYQGVWAAQTPSNEYYMITITATEIYVYVVMYDEGTPTMIPEMIATTVSINQGAEGGYTITILNAYTFVFAEPNGDEAQLTINGENTVTLTRQDEE